MNGRLFLRVAKFLQPKLFFLFLSLFVHMHTFLLCEYP